MIQTRIQGNWEPKMFMKRRGDGSFCDVDRLWTDIHSDASIGRMKQLGINQSHVHFHKGYGLEGEKKSIEEARDYAAKLHENGIRVGVYIGMTLFYETFKHPDYEDMIIRNSEVGWNNDQYFRQSWCYSSPASIKYFREVIKIAIEYVKADVLHFDLSFCSSYLGKLCKCKYCLEKFRVFMRETIPGAAAAAGYDDPELLLPPPNGGHEFLAGLEGLKELGKIAWTLFHAQNGYEAMKLFTDYARSLKTDIGIFYNGCLMAGTTRYSRPDMPIKKLALADYTCTEDCNENPVHTTEDGMPVSRFRSYKIGSRTQTSVCYYTTTVGQNNQLMLAEAAAFNYASLGFVETAMQQNHILENPEDIRFLKYIADNETLFLNRKPWHSIAVLRHHESELLNQFPCGLSSFVVEQMLFERHVPFAIIDSDELQPGKSPSEFDLLILADCKSMSDKELDTVEFYVKTGGRILSIGNTGMANEFNQFRGKWGLGNIFRRDAAPVQFLKSYDEIAQSQAVVKQPEDFSGRVSLHAEYGKGRAIHIGSLDFDLPDKHDLNKFGGFDWYYHPYWRHPLNKEEFWGAFDRLTADVLHVETNLPRHAGVEYYRIENGYRVYIVNFKTPETINTSTLNITVQEPNGHYQITWQAPFDREESMEVDAIEKRLTISLPAVEIMLIITIICLKQNGGIFIKQTNH